ncbi:hypothetical protein GTHT12_01177 [Geobacillus thermodenitrificans]|nr:hypothetical protein GTHT12_01177 [Geobacillus thermodenitrificans]
MDSDALVYFVLGASFYFGTVWLSCVNYHFISEQKSHFFAHSFRKPSPLF